MLLSYRELWWQKSLSNRLYNYEAHNHERGKIKKVILPPFCFFLERFPLSFQKKCVFHQNRSFLACARLHRHYSLVSFSRFTSLVAQSPSYTLSSFLICWTLGERRKERERGVRERFYVWARYNTKRSFCVCASSFDDAKTSPFVVILLIRCTF